MLCFLWLLAPLPPKNGLIHFKCEVHLQPSAVPAWTFQASNDNSTKWCHAINLRNPTLTLWHKGETQIGRSGIQYMNSTLKFILYLSRETLVNTELFLNQLLHNYFYFNDSHDNSGTSTTAMAVFLTALTELIEWFIFFNCASRPDMKHSHK